MNKTKKLCYLAVMTALYIVLGSFFKINIIGNIQIDLGYIVFAVALCKFGVVGAVVGVLGCALESILFSAYGFSVGWAVANAIIGIGCGVCFMRTNKTGMRALAIIVFCATGMLFAKTIIECTLYSIPIAVKLPKSAVAFAVDSVAMIIGLFVFNRIETKNKVDG